MAHVLHSVRTKKMKMDCIEEDRGEETGELDAQGGAFIHCIRTSRGECNDAILLGVYTPGHEDRMRIGVKSSAL